jgi:hypothetical protein
VRAEPTSGWNVKWPAIRAWGRSHSRVYWIGGRRIRAALKAPSGKGRKWARDHHGVRPAPARSSRSPWRAVRAAAPVASCSCCSARSGRPCRRALSAHARCCRGVIKKRSGGSSIIGIYPSVTVSSPCCTHRALHQRCNVGAFRTLLRMRVGAARPKNDRHHIASAVCGASLILVDRQRHVRRFMKTQLRPGGALFESEPRRVEDGQGSGLMTVEAGSWFCH